MSEDYDIPEAPAGASAEAAASIDSGAVAGMFDGVPDLGEPIPIGTYHFRLAKYAQKWTSPTEEEKAKGGLPEPYYAVEWHCQQEPHVGRIHFENIPWVRKEMVTAAAAGDPNARKYLNNRLPRAKNIMEAAGFKPTGNFDFETDFLALNPEIKIQLGLQAAKTKDASGKYVETGSFRNKTVRYYPLHRG